MNKSIQLASGESLLYNWTYASVKEGKFTGEKRLAVTNRRIISDSQVGPRYNREEINLSDVKTVNGSVNYNRIPALLIFGILFLLAAAAAYKVIYAAIILAVVALIFILCYAFIKRTRFNLHIETRRVEGEIFRLGVNIQKLPATVKAYRRKTAKRNRSRAYINVGVAQEILSVIGSLPYISSN